MRYGLNQKNYDWLLQNIVKPINQAGGQVYIFGSRAIDKSNPYSDIDLMIESTKNLRPLISNLSELAVNSNFPYKIDLVFWNDFAKDYLSSYETQKNLITT